MRERTESVKPSPRICSAVSNRTKLLTGTDGRTSASRRFRDIVRELSDPLGGVRGLSDDALTMVKQAAAMTMRAEMLQADIVKGVAVDTDELIRLSGETRRILADLRKRGAARKPAPQKRLQDHLTARYGTPTAVPA